MNRVCGRIRNLRSKTGPCCKALGFRRHCYSNNNDDNRAVTKRPARSARSLLIGKSNSTNTCNGRCITQRASDANRRRQTPGPLTPASRPNILCAPPLYPGLPVCVFEQNNPIDRRRSYGFISGETLPWVSAFGNDRVFSLRSS